MNSFKNGILQHQWLILQETSLFFHLLVPVNEKRFNRDAKTIGWEGLIDLLFIDFSSFSSVKTT